MVNEKAGLDFPIELDLNPQFQELISETRYREFTFRKDVRVRTSTQFALDLNPQSQDLIIEARHREFIIGDDVKVKAQAFVALDLNPQLQRRIIEARNREFIIGDDVKGIVQASLSSRLESSVLLVERPGEIAEADSRLGGLN